MMWNVFLLSLVLVHSIIRPVVESSYETAVAIKRGIQDYNDSMAIVVSGFKDLIKKNKVFVDNTLMIEEQIQTSAHIYYMAPRKWGKTVILDMLQTFFQLHVDDQGKPVPKETTDSYKLFNHNEIVHDDGTVEILEMPLLISKRKIIIDDYQGNYPVIRVNFGDVIGNNLTEVKKAIGDAIRKAYQEHKYMINVLQTTEQESLKNKSDELMKIFKDDAFDDHSMFKSIRLLSEVLSIHFKHKTVILFDDYDRPVLNIMRVPTFSRDEAKEMSKIMDCLAGTTFMHNMHLAYVVVAGTFELYQLVDYSTWEHYYAMDAALNSQSITQYFGFSREDVQRLFDLHEISDELCVKAHQWYNGHVSETTSRQIYNPHSIVSFLKHRKLGNYWPDEGDFKLLSKSFKKHIHIRNRLLSLLSRQLQVQIHRKRRLSEDEINNMKTGDHRNSYDNFIWYFFRIGYLTYQPFTAQVDRHKMNYIYVKIPNIQSLQEIANWMMTYYRKRYYVIEPLFESCAAEFLKFVNDKFAEQTPFRLSLQRMYKEARHPPIPWANYSSMATENPVHNLFTSIALKSQCMCSFELDIYLNRAMEIFTVVVNRRIKQAFLIELRYTEKTVETVLSSINKHIPIAFKNFTEVEQVNAVAISLSSTKAIGIVVKKTYRDQIA